MQYYKLAHAMRVEQHLDLAKRLANALLKQQERRDSPMSLAIAIGMLLDHVSAVEPHDAMAKHGSWLNLVEGFVSNLTRSVLRPIRGRAQTGTEEFNDRPHRPRQ